MMVMKSSLMKTQIMIADNVTSNGGSEEKVAKSRGASEGDGGGRHQHLGRVQREQNQAGDIYLYLMHTLVYIYGVLKSMFYLES